jgi:senataxin
MIRQFPGSEFYGGRLLDGRTLVPYTDLAPRLDTTQPLLREPALYASEVFGPVRFFNIVPRAPPRSSYENPAEARVVARLAISLFMAGVKAPLGGKAGGMEAKLDLRGKVGVVTPYRKQVGLVKDALRDDLDHGGKSERSKSWVKVATVDGFQGQEQEVILISCVRTSRTHDGRRGGIGFLREKRRLNVALTRAKSAVLIVGDAAWLARHDPTWRRLVDFCRASGVMWEVADSVRTTPSIGTPPAWSCEGIWSSLGARMKGWV